MGSLDNPKKWNIFTRSSQAVSEHADDGAHELQLAAPQPFDEIMPDDSELEKIRADLAEKLRREAAEEARKQEALKSGRTIDGKNIQPHTNEELQARAQWLSAEVRAIEKRGGPHEIVFVTFPTPRGASDSFIRMERNWEDYLPADIRSVVDYILGSEKKKFTIRLDREFTNGDRNDRRWTGVKAFLTWQ
jgi:hypothetical protein